MKLHELTPGEGARKTSRRIGRGHGSGRVKTSGKGNKGQNARSGGGVRPGFEGGQNPWTMRIPHKRGFHRGRFQVESQVVNLADLERHFSAGDTITLATLAERGIIDSASGQRPVKLLGSGALTKKLTLEVHNASKSARAAFESAGGSLTLLRAPAERVAYVPNASGGNALKESSGGSDGTAAGSEGSAS